MSFNPRWIVGKRVAEVHMNASRDAAGRVLHDPTIVFDDGSSICFITEEDHDGGEYGVDIIYRKAISRLSGQTPAGIVETLERAAVRLSGDQRGVSVRQVVAAFDKALALGEYHDACRDALVAELCRVQPVESAQQREHYCPSRFRLVEGDFENCAECNPSVEKDGFGSANPRTDEKATATGGHFAESAQHSEPNERATDWKYADRLDNIAAQGHALSITERNDIEIAANLLRTASRRYDAAGDQQKGAGE